MSNKTVLAKGHKKALNMIAAHMIEVGVRFAKRALFEAVVAWDEDKDSNDLTGNVRTGFCAGVYYNRHLVREPITVFEAGLAIGRPTHGFTRPGDSGFRDYSSGENIGSEEDPAVKQYNPDRQLTFQPVPYGGYGYEVSSSWLRNHKPNHDGLAIVIVNAVPYVEYLKEARKLDILESTATSGSVSSMLLNSFLDVNFSDFENVTKSYG